MIFEIIFEHGTSAEALKRALAEQFDIPSERVFVGTAEELTRLLLDDKEMPYPMALIGGERRSGEFTCSFESHDRLLEAVGDLSVTALATVLCKAVKTRALVDDGGYAGDCFVLVTPDGWHGRVRMTDEALDGLVFDLEYALDPIPSDPSMPVIVEPDQEHWYPDGKVPEPGYAFPEDEPKPRPESDG